ncbi:hypothetical protein BDN71DRAFT_460624 [Pleurotus eryngii]|uniref:Uncharacterized protein n=1 Tax=Pleurotus eryngii TaxID=5323 RepID=A0A9P6D997_PLEER|nr:hypothetical protein BDN71DRAFT_460624 [Pleurotus eryngii]
MMVRRGDAAPGFGMRRTKQFRYFLISRSGPPPSVRLLLDLSPHYYTAFDLCSVHAHHCVIIQMDTALLVLALTRYLQFIRMTAMLLGVYGTAGVGEGERRLRDTAAHETPGHASTSPRICTAKISSYRIPEAIQTLCL